MTAVLPTTDPDAARQADIELAYRILRNAYARDGQVPALSIAETFVDDWVTAKARQSQGTEAAA
jgi:hypothetical protein